MEERFVILCCENIRPEVDAVLATGAMPRAVAESFPFHCGHVRSVWETIRDTFGKLDKAGDSTCLCGCGCANTLDLPGEVRKTPSLVLAESGAPLFLPETLVHEYRREGKYLILPGWLLRWKINAESDGLDTTTAREMFRESLTEIILLDTGVHPGIAPILAEFAEFTGLPARTLNVGLEHFRFRLLALYSPWQCGQDVAASQASVCIAEKRVADYSMVADLTGRIIGVHDEGTVIRQMLELVILLCSPKRAGFLVIGNDRPGGIISTPPDAYASPAHFQKPPGPDHLYSIHAGDNGFLFLVKYNESLLGILSVDEISIPAALNEYLNLTHFICQIAGLSITIARTHQALVRTVGERDAEIAERKKIGEELLLHSEILQNMAEGVALIRASDGTIVFTNTRFSALFGYSPGELDGMNVSVLNAPDIRSAGQIAQEIITVLEEQGAWSGEIRNVRKDGTEFWCQAAVSTYEYPAIGRVWITVHEDITEQKTFETALRESEEKYRNIIENMQDLYYRTDPSGKITMVSPWGVKLMGYAAPENLIGQDIGWLFDDLSERDRFMEALQKKGSVYAYPLRFRDRLGMVRHVTTSSHYIRDMNGEIRGTEGVIHDITARVRAESALRESEERYRTIIENIQDAFIRIDSVSHIVMASPSAARMFGYPSSTEMIGMPVVTLWRYPEKRAEFLLAMQTQGGAVHDWEAEYVRKDGTPFWVAISGHLRTDEQGDFAGSEALIRDISERKKIEGALKGAIKKLNMLSSITRHDILNQITGLRTYLDLSREDLKGTRFAAFVEKEDQAAEAIQRQIEFTKYYQDIGVNAPKWQDAGAVIREALQQLNPPGIDVQIAVSDLEIFADPLIVKVFFNLMENSLRHGERVTRLSFSTRESGVGLVLTYRDNGVGITGEDKKKLFQKGFGKHTGLGLFLSREILAITGISIVENGEPGNGVQFEMTVPKEGYRSTR